MNDNSPLSVLFFQFSLLSLLAFGGANAVVPEMFHQISHIHHWISESEMTSLYAISQTLPGPNVLFVTLIGWRVAGPMGAIVTTIGMCVPCAILTFVTSRLWINFNKIDKRKKLLMAMNSITVGFVLASAYLLSKSVDTTIRHAVITLITFLVAMFYKKINLLWLIGAGAIAGFFIL